MTLSSKKVVSAGLFAGKLKYKKVSGSKKIKVAANGKVTLKKGLKRGSYKVKVKVQASGDDMYKASAWKEAVFTIKVK